MAPPKKDNGEDPKRSVSADMLATAVGVAPRGMQSRPLDINAASKVLPMARKTKKQLSSTMPTTWGGRISSSGPAISASVHNSNDIMARTRNRLNVRLAIRARWRMHGPFNFRSAQQAEVADQYTGE